MENKQKWVAHKMQELLSQLSEIADEAEYLGNLAEQEPDAFTGMEAGDIAGVLRDVYNAFMTGDKYNDQFEDQEFK
jgi:hypothetical protein